MPDLILRAQPVGATPSNQVIRMGSPRTDALTRQVSFLQSALSRLTIVSGRLRMSPAYLTRELVRDAAVGRVESGEYLK